MKLNNLLSFILFLSLFTGLNAEDFYTYKLYKNEFQAVFPGQPSMQEIPKELLDPIAIENSIPYEYRRKLTRKQLDKIVSDIINKNNIQAYYYADRDNQISYTTQSRNSGFKYDIGEYKQSTKKTLDDSIIEPLKASGHQILNFSSIFDRSKNIYTALYSSSYYLEGQKRYKSAKEIVYKKKSYKWAMMYSNINDKEIFDSYKDYCNVIK